MGRKGNMIYPDTLKNVKKISSGTTIVSYSDDDMFNISNRTKAFTNSLRYYDIIFVTKSYNANKHELPALGANRVVVVDKAFDPKQHYPIEITESEKTALGSDVTFIGSYAPERGRILHYLSQNGITIRVWGNGWEKFNSKSFHLKIERKPLVNNLEDLLFTKGIIASKINLGFLRKANRDLQTDRSIEIPACGGFLLTERTLEHERLFIDKKEAVFFDNKEDLLEKIKYFLANDEQRREISLAGYTKCINAGYTHKNRMQFMLDVALNNNMLP